VTATPHLSIGEVLSLLQTEFPDITISKIRFLESQGLLEPERSPSGYRKFYPHDIERLRWILRQQRDNFLPLRVIKDKLEDGGGLDDGDTAEPADEPEAETIGQEGDPPAEDGESAGVVEAAEATDRNGGEPVAATAAADEQDVLPGLRGPLDPGPSSVSLTLEELAKASGLEIRVVVELEQYGMIVARTLGQTKFYDGEALAVSRLAASFRDFGFETRHLRMFKTAADREASVYEQMILPLVRQRDPVAVARARSNLSDLARLGESVHRAMLRQALRPHLES
jgi:DNA-binding transcriptional MerR regulator